VSEDSNDLFVTPFEDSPEFYTVKFLKDDREKIPQTADNIKDKNNFRKLVRKI